MLPDWERHPGDALERRDKLLVADADAVVVAGEEIDLPTYRIVGKVKAKGGRVLVVRRKPSEVAGAEALEMTRRGSAGLTLTPSWMDARV